MKWKFLYGRVIEQECEEEEREIFIIKKLKEEIKKDSYQCQYILIVKNAQAVVSVFLYVLSKLYRSSKKRL